MKPVHVFLLATLQILLQPTAANQCNADNCLRAIIHYSSQAVEFCHDYMSIAPITSTVTALPSYVSQYPASRVSSACSCIEASPGLYTTVTATTISSSTAGSSTASTTAIPNSSAGGSTFSTFTVPKTSAGSSSTGTISTTTIVPSSSASKLPIITTTSTSTSTTIVTSSSSSQNLPSSSSTTPSTASTSNSPSNLISTTMVTSTLSKSTTTMTPGTTLISSASTLSSIYTPSITPTLSGKSTATTTSTSSNPSTTSTSLTTSTVTASTSSASSMSSVAPTANGVTYSVINSPTPSYRLPVPTGVLRSYTFQGIGEDAAPDITAYYDVEQHQAIYLSATSPGGITPLWDVTNPSQIAMTIPGQFSVIIDDSGIYMSLWDWSAEISATAPNFFSLLNGVSAPAPASKYRARSASLKTRGLTDFLVNLTTTGNCYAGQAPPHLAAGENNCTVTTISPGQYLGACSFPPGGTDCQLILDASLDSIFAISPAISSFMKAAQILNGIEQTALAQSASLFTPYLGDDLMNSMTWMGTFASAAIGQSARSQRAADAARQICAYWGAATGASLWFSAPGSDNPTSIYSLDDMPTTTVVITASQCVP